RRVVGGGGDAGRRCANADLESEIGFRRIAADAELCGRADLCGGERIRVGSERIEAEGELERVDKAVAFRIGSGAAFSPRERVRGGPAVVVERDGGGSGR